MKYDKANPYNREVSDKVIVKETNIPAHLSLVGVY